MVREVTRRRLPYFVAIGASGSEGLNDISTLLGALPAIPAIVMVVLHRPSGKISFLREILARNCRMPVVIATECEALISSTCYIGEPDEHLTLFDTNLAHLVPGFDGRLRNRTVDTLFESLAVHAGIRTIGVVLSGSLDDGSRGLTAIHAAGGITMVLEPGYKPRGMQQNAIDFDGPISFIGSAVEIAGAIVQVMSRGKDGAHPDNES
jgi:two-component system chemotaxis response regulator CheB